MIYIFVSNDIMYGFTFNIYMGCVMCISRNECLHVHTLMNRYTWEYVCIVNLTVILIIPSSTLHLLIFCGCGVSLGSLLFAWKHRFMICCRGQFMINFMCMVQHGWTPLMVAEQYLNKAVSALMIYLLTTAAKWRRRRVCVWLSSELSGGDNILYHLPIDVVRICGSHL